MLRTRLRTRLRNRRRDVARHHAANPSQAEWAAENQRAAANIPPVLGYSPVTDQAGQEKVDWPGEWWPLTYLTEPPLVARQVAALQLHRPTGDADGRLPLLAWDRVTGLVAIQLGDDWWWLDFATKAPADGWDTSMVRYAPAEVTQ